MTENIYSEHLYDHGILIRSHPFQLPVCFFLLKTAICCLYGLCETFYYAALTANHFLV